MEFICKECGEKVESEKWCKSFAEKIEKEHLCFHCDFWMEKVELKDRPNSVRVNGNAYWLEPDRSEGYRGFLGFGGAEFRIKFNDGRYVVSHNLWHNGTVPERFRDRLPDNAEFVKEESKKEKNLKSAGFSKEVKEVKKGNCPFCVKEVKLDEFRDSLSLDEFHISGLCQKCQDEFFGSVNEEKVNEV